VLGALLGAAGAALILRRRSLERRERVDLYYEDGSMVSVDEGAPDSGRLLALARDALLAARTAR
jgi:hypothetical protein